MVVLGSSELTQVNRAAGIQSDSGSSSEGSGSKKREENLLLRDCRLTVSPNKACASDASSEDLDAVDSTGTGYTLPSCNGHSEHSIFKIPENTGISVKDSNKFNNTFMTYPGYKVSGGFYNRTHDAPGTNFQNCSHRERNTSARVSPCKIYQSRKNHRHLDKSKHRNVGSGNKVNSKGNEYFLLKPSMHWHNSVTLSWNKASYTQRKIYAVIDSYVCCISIETRLTVQCKRHKCGTKVLYNSLFFFF